MAIFSDASSTEGRPVLPSRYSSSLTNQTRLEQFGSFLVRRAEDVPARMALVNDNGLLGSIIGITPKIPFQTMYDYYDSVPEFQNVVEQIIAEILSRDWYFAKKDKGGSEQGVKDMEAFEEKYNLSRIFEYLIRDWLITGNSIISIVDWQPVQMSSIYSMVRDRFGNTEYFIQRVSGAPDVKIPLRQVIHTRFIERDRQAWGIPWAYSLMNTFTDVDNNTSKAEFDWWRQLKQDSGRIVHKLGAPREMYYFPGIPQSTVDQRIGPDLQKQKPGDILALGGLNNTKPEIVSDTIDTKTRFEGHHALMTNSIQAGLQSSAIRLITEPSAMADAREANKKDDARILGVMEKIRRFMQEIVIPKITSSKVEFKWGKQDQMDIDLVQAMELVKLPILSTEEKRKLLMSVGVPLESEKPPEELVQQQQQMLQVQTQQSQRNDRKQKQAEEIYQKKAELLRKLEQSIVNMEVKN